MSGFIAVDLDGTLAYYTKFHKPDVIGDPIPKMLDRVKKWLAEGKDVRICTARVFPIGMDIAKLVGLEFDTYTEAGARLYDAGIAKKAIEEWCVKHIGMKLPIICYKSYKMFKLWDDRAIQVVPNTGERVDGKE